MTHSTAPNHAFEGGVNPVRNSSRCDSKPSGALNPVRDLSLNGINPALRGGTRNYSKMGNPAAASGSGSAPEGLLPRRESAWLGESSGALFLTG